MVVGPVLTIGQKLDIQATYQEMKNIQQEQNWRTHERPDWLELFVYSKFNVNIE